MLACLLIAFLDSGVPDSWEYELTLAELNFSSNKRFLPIFNRLRTILINIIVNQLCFRLLLLHAILPFVNPKLTFCVNWPVGWQWLSTIDIILFLIAAFFKDTNEWQALQLVRILDMHLLLARLHGQGLLTNVVKLIQSLEFSLKVWIRSLYTIALRSAPFLVCALWTATTLAQTNRCRFKIHYVLVWYEMDVCL